MLRAFAAGAGAAFMAVLGLLLTLGGIAVTFRWMLRQADAEIGRSVRSIFSAWKPPRPMG